MYTNDNLEETKLFVDNPNLCKDKVNYKRMLN